MEGLGEESGFAACGGAGKVDLGRVDISLGDGGLGVASLLLDVAHGVAGGGFVGEGGVAEVVEGPKRFRDAPVLECWFEVFAGEA